MKRLLYAQVIARLYRVDPRNISKELCKEFPEIPEFTINAIVSLECQKKTKRCYWKHHMPETRASYYDRYLKLANAPSKHGFLLELSRQIDLAPSLLARIILDQFYPDKNNGELLSKKMIGQLIKDTSLIEDRILAVEVHLCTINDDDYGPITNLFGRAVGLEYEEKLKASLKELEISFVDEEMLRASGCDKTPDIKLQVPIAIDGHVVNWIESKASFGDEESHKGYLKEQYWSYWNRYGPGLVIYWFGFIDELDVHREQGIVVMDDLPTEITRLEPLLLMQL